MESTKTKLQSKNRKKSESMNKKNRFFLCFRPVSMDGSLKTVRRTDGRLGDPIFTCIAAGDKGGMELRRISPPILALDRAEKEEEGSGDWRKKDGNGRLSRILKTVFTANSLKNKKRKLGRGSFRSESNITASSIDMSDSLDENSMHKHKMFDDNNLRADSNVSSSLRCSSALTSTCFGSSRSNSRTTSDTRSSSQRSKSFGPNAAVSKQRGQDSIQEGRKGCHASNVVLCLLLISLVVLIFCGKICSILCTSTWFIFIRWSARHEYLEDGAESPKIVSKLESESEEYNKEVVMEGPLRRNRSRRLLTF
ncbi:hypothetical protein F2P56_005298 [Juglans regia]|uniref:Uncharacterized protein n=1 Tax=Juglans regia TaxID=51240 RepID=A0A834D6S7_JUGRE|nr:hypothetical protein F2P56_005298 [Juglans regia]